MIRSFTVTNPSNESLEIELENPGKSGFLAAGISGLGPPKADINTTSIAGFDGSIHNSSRVDSRNIVIPLVYVGDDIEELRHKTYKYFPIKKLVTLTFKTDTRIAAIDGYVESNEVSPFSSMEASQISIICNDPWFIDVSGSNVPMRLSNVDPLFQFPVEFVPEDGEENGTVEFSRVKQIVTGKIPYYGDMETGIKMTIRASSKTGNIIIANMDTREQMTIYSDIVKNLTKTTSNPTGTEISKGDEIIITTHTGKKRVQLFRNGKYKNIISAVDKTSNWFKLSRGINNFSCSPAQGDVEVIVENDILYEGL